MLTVFIPLPAVSLQSNKSTTDAVEGDSETSDATDVFSPVVSAYTWGSRGPSPDGSLDIMVSAAGGAVADVAAWEYQASGLKNGSSMSSPAVAGAVCESFLHAFGNISYFARFLSCSFTKMFSFMRRDYIHHSLLTSSSQTQSYLLS